MQIDIPGERGAEKPRSPTYDVNPIRDGNNSNDIVRHFSMVEAVKDMISIAKYARRDIVYGWHIQYNDGSRNPPWAEFILEDKNDRRRHLRQTRRSSWVRISKQS